MSGDVVLHLRGRVLLGPDEERPEAWVVGGRLTYEAPLARVDEAQDVEGWVLPGLVDAHCHIGVDAHGAVDEATQERQAVTDRDAGVLLARDCGVGDYGPRVALHTVDRDRGAVNLAQPTGIAGQEGAQPAAISRSPTCSLPRDSLRR